MGLRSDKNKEYVMTGKEIAEALKLGGIENYIFEARLLCEELCGSYSEDKEYSSEKITSATVAIRFNIS